LLCGDFWDCESIILDPFSVLSWLRVKVLLGGDGRCHGKELWSPGGAFPIPRLLIGVGDSRFDHPPQFIDTGLGNGITIKFTMKARS
jgi:hypothetical protein